MVPFCSAEVGNFCSALDSTWLAQRPRYQIHLRGRVPRGSIRWTMIWPDHPARHSSRFIPQRRGIGTEDRFLRPALQPHQQVFRVDRHARVDPRQNHPTLFTYFRDATLEHDGHRGHSYFVHSLADRISCGINDREAITAAVCYVDGRTVLGDCEGCR
jgi:hypothetical protein